MRISSNVARGAVTTGSGIIVGGFCEYCMVCGNPMSSDGCSNIDCIHSRPTHLLQLGMRAAAVQRLFKIKREVPNGTTE